jgi:hypothetical protein
MAQNGTAGQAGEDGLSGRDVVFTLDRKYRTPLITRGGTALVLAGLAAAIASIDGGRPTAGASHRNLTGRLAA